MTRRCSHCSHNGHNSRTCPSRGVKLFGVRITDGSIRKSVSMGNLMHYSNGGGSPADGTEGGGSPPEAAAAEEKEAGYASEDFVKGSNSSCRERKKGIAWTEEEHKKFLLGLRKLGKGDWRGIARTYVVSRTPTQVASHAQKYFIRQSNANRRKKRSSLFDIKPDEFVDVQSLPMGSQEPEAEKSNPLPVPPPMDAECESVVSNSNEEVAVPLPRPETTQYPYPVMYPAFYSSYYPVPLPFFPGYRADTVENKSHEVFKPTALHSKVNADQLACMSTLSLRESRGETSSPSTTLNLLGGSERHSAFHANTRPPTGSRMNSGSSPIHAI